MHYLKRKQQLKVTNHKKKRKLNIYKKKDNCIHNQKRNELNENTHKVKTLKREIFIFCL